MTRCWRPASAGLFLLCLAAACAPDGDREFPPCRAALHGSVVRAAGNEPFWNAAIAETGIRFTRLAGAGVEEQTWPCISASAGENSFLLRATSDGVIVEIAVREHPCADTMADRDYPMTAVITFGDGERVLRGCAWKEGEEPAGSP